MILWSIYYNTTVQVLAHTLLVLNRPVEMKKILGEGTERLLKNVGQLG